MKMAQCMDGKLCVADGDKRAGRALDVEGVADAFKAHLGADARHVVFAVHICSTEMSMSQCHLKHLVLLRRGSNRGPSPIVERVRGR